MNNDTTSLYENLSKKIIRNSKNNDEETKCEDNTYNEMEDYDVGINKPMLSSVMRKQSKEHHQFYNKEYIEKIKRLKENKYFGDKTIGKCSSYIYLINQIFGSGIVSIPYVFKSCGWLPCFFMNIFICILTAINTLLFLRTMTMIPNNMQFNKRYEYISTVCYFLGKKNKFFLFIQFCFYASILASNIISIVIVSHAIDHLLIKTFGETWSFVFYPTFGFTFFTDITELYYTKNYTIGITVGYLLNAIISIYFSQSNLEDNMKIQFLSFFFLMGTIFQMLYLSIIKIYQYDSTKTLTTVLATSLFTNFNEHYFQTNNFSPTHKNRFSFADTIKKYSDIKYPTVFGNYNFRQLLSSYIASYSTVTVIPCWANEMKKDVEIIKTVWGSNIFCCFIYYLYGYILCTAYPHINNDNILNDILQNPLTNIYMKVSIYLFDLLTIAPGIYVYCIATRYNLINSNICSEKLAFIFGTIFPFLISWIFTSSVFFEDVFTWSSLIFSFACNFIAPSVIYLIACKNIPLSEKNPLKYMHVLYNPKEHCKTNYFYDILYANKNENSINSRKNDLGNRKCFVELNERKCKDRKKEIKFYGTNTDWNEKETSYGWNKNLQNKYDFAEFGKNDIKSNEKNSEQKGEWEVTKYREINRTCINNMQKFNLKKKKCKQKNEDEDADEDIDEDVDKDGDEDVNEDADEDSDEEKIEKVKRKKINSKETDAFLCNECDGSINSFSKHQKKLKRKNYKIDENDETDTSLKKKENEHRHGCNSLVVEINKKHSKNNLLNEIEKISNKKKQLPLKDMLLMIDKESEKEKTEKCKRNKITKKMTRTRFSEIIEEINTYENGDMHIDSNEEKEKDKQKEEKNTEIVDVEEKANEEGTEEVEPYAENEMENHKKKSDDYYDRKIKKKDLFGIRKYNSMFIHDVPKIHDETEKINKFERSARSSRKHKTVIGFEKRRNKNNIVSTEDQSACNDIDFNEEYLNDKIIADLSKDIYNDIEVIQKNYEREKYLIKYADIFDSFLNLKIQLEHEKKEKNSLYSYNTEYTYPYTATTMNSKTEHTLSSSISRNKCRDSLSNTSQKDSLSHVYVFPNRTNNASDEAVEQNKSHTSEQEENNYSETNLKKEENCTTIKEISNKNSLTWASDEKEQNMNEQNKSICKSKNSINASTQKYYSKYNNIKSLSPHCKKLNSVSDYPIFKDNEKEIILRKMQTDVATVSDKVDCKYLISNKHVSSSEDMKESEPQKKSHSYNTKKKALTLDADCLDSLNKEKSLLKDAENSFYNLNAHNSIDMDMYKMLKKKRKKQKKKKSAKSVTSSSDMYKNCKTKDKLLNFLNAYNKKNKLYKDMNILSVPDNIYNVIPRVNKICSKSDIDDDINNIFNYYKYNFLLSFSEGEIHRDINVYSYVKNSGVFSCDSLENRNHSIYGRNSMFNKKNYSINQNSSLEKQSITEKNEYTETSNRNYKNSYLNSWKDKEKTEPLLTDVKIKDTNISDISKKYIYQEELPTINLICAEQPIYGYEDAYQIDDCVNGKVNENIIHVYPSTYLRIKHVEITELLLTVTIILLFISILYNFIY